MDGEQNELQRDVSLAPHSTMGLGGRARYFVVCESVAAIRQSLDWAKERGLPLQVLGGGSNILFPDEGFEGLVLKVGVRGRSFEAEGEWVRVRAGAGEEWDALVRECVALGLGGIECLSGIPGLVGATPIQNVGAYGQEVKETIVEVKALERQSLAEVVFSSEACGFRYRQSRFKGEDHDRYLIVEVCYRLRRQGRPQWRYPPLRRRLEERVDPERLGRGAPGLRAVREAVLALRRRKSMLFDPRDPDARSVGSFFLNPVLKAEEFRALEQRRRAGPIPFFAEGRRYKVPAAWLVEQAGFHKGYRREGAGISSKHALALINCGGTTAGVLALAAEIQQRVEERFGIRLEREPVVAGTGTRAATSSP